MKKKILLVDDQEDALVLMCGALQSLVDSERLVTAQGGDEALSLLHGPDPLEVDLVFLDIRMPRIDGLEVLRRIRQDPRTRDLNVVIVSSSTYKGDIERAEELGAEYLVKPMDIKEFRIRLKEFIERYLPD